MIIKKKKLKIKMKRRIIYKIYTNYNLKKIKTKYKKKIKLTYKTKSKLFSIIINKMKKKLNYHY